MIQAVEPSGTGCADCLAGGTWWVHRRICLTCGKVGCCDESPNRHARAHFRTEGHPIIRSFEPDESWVWCFADQVEIEETAPSAD